MTRKLRYAELFAYAKGRRRFLMLGILISLFLHALILIYSPSYVRKKPTERVPITYTIKKKPKALPDNDPKNDDVKDKDKAKPKPKPKEPDRTIIEAPLLPTTKPDEPAHLGAQNHMAVIEQKTQPQNIVPGAPSTALQNGRIKIEGGLPDEKGTIPVPAKHGTKYSRLLPREGEMLNLAHNDYIHDKNIPKGAILDVNTTDFRWIGYFTAVRRQVELSFTDIGPTLRSSPYVKARLSEHGKADFQGSSVVRLKVERSGLLTEAKLTSSSGDKDIDTFWIKILNVAAPYPPLPKDYPDETLMFTYTLYYDIVIEDDRRVRRFIY